MQRHFVMAPLQHHSSPCNSSTGGRTPLRNDTCATLSLQGTYFANKATALTLPSEGQVCPQSHRMKQPGQQLPLSTQLLSPKTTLGPSPFLSQEMAGNCSQQQPCSRLWDAPGFLPFTRIGVMEDYPPASESRAGSYSALSPQSNLYRPALRHSIFPPPRFRNRQTVFSLALLLGVPFLPGGNN